MSPKQMDMDDIREKYKRKTYPDLSILFGYYRLEIILTNLFLKFNVSANAITGVSFFLGILGCSLLVLGLYSSMVIGAALLILSAFLDYIDGNVARKTNSVDNFGKLVDLLNEHIVMGFSIVAMGIGVSRSYQPFSIFFIPRPELLGFAATLSHFMYRFINMYCLHIIGNNKSVKEQQNTETTKKGFILWFSHLWSFVGLYTPITLVATIFLKLNLWFVVTAFAYIFDGVTSSIRVFYSMYKFKTSNM